MEKTITIGGRPINFKATGGTLCIYKQQFQEEYYNDLFSLETMEKSNLHTPQEVYLRRYKIGFQLIWAMAKNADNSIPDPETWAKQFKVFPMQEILPQVTELFRLKEGEKSSNGGEQITSERLVACAVACGLTKEDVYELPIDFLINSIEETIDLKGGKKNKTRKATQQDFMNF